MTSVAASFDKEAAHLYSNFLMDIIVEEGYRPQQMFDIGETVILEKDVSQ